MVTLNLKKLAHSLGLTKTERTELSDLISEPATVTGVFSESGNYQFYPEYSHLKGIGGISDSSYTNYFVRLASDAKSFEVNNEFFFRTFQVGDRVELKYRNISSVVLDYADEDFSQKKELKREIVGYKIESAEKIKS